MSATSLALAAIDAYQRVVSPRKGYTCAYAAAHGGPGCSGAVRSEIAARGIARAAVPSLGRLAACASAWRSLRGGSRAATVEGLCCCGPIPIPIRF